MEVGGAGIVGEKGWCGGEVAVKGEAKGAACGGDAADNVGAVDGGGVPSVGGYVDDFNADFGVAAALVGGNGEGFVEEAE